MQKRVSNANYYIFHPISKNRNTRFFKTNSVSGKNRNSVRFFGLPNSSTHYPPPPSSLLPPSFSLHSPPSSLLLLPSSLLHSPPFYHHPPPSSLLPPPSSFLPPTTQGRRYGGRGCLELRASREFSSVFREFFQLSGIFPAFGGD